MIKTVYIDGIDKTGKTSLVTYLRFLSNWNIIPVDRGPITSCVIQNLSDENSKNVYKEYTDSICIFLTIEKFDWNMRCALTNENPIPYEIANKQWEHHSVLAEESGMKIIKYNTSIMTLFQIANDLVKKLKD